MASVFLEGSASGQIPGPCQGNQLDREIERDICHWEDESGSVQCVTATSSCGIMLNKCQLHSCFHLTLCSSHPAIQADSLSALLLGGITEFIFNLCSHCQWTAEAVAGNASCGHLVSHSHKCLHTLSASLPLISLLPGLFPLSTNQSSPSIPVIVLSIFANTGSSFFAWGSNLAHARPCKTEHHGKCLWF